MVSNNIFKLQPPEMDELTDIDGDYSTGQILRHLAENLFLSEDTQRKECVNELWTMKWKEQEAIQQFNS